jgi:hypothetical protein
MLKKVVLAVGLIAIPSIAPAQQEQCQLECTRVTEKGETRVTRSCYALNAADCANLGRAESGGNKTCRGLHHVELRPRSLRYYRRKDGKDCAESRRDAVIVDAKTRHRFKLDTKRTDTPSGDRWPMSALGQKRTFMPIATKVHPGQHAIIRSPGWQLRAAPARV